MSISELVSVQGFTIRPQKPNSNRVRSEKDVPKHDFISSIDSSGQLKSVVPTTPAGPFVIPLALQRTFLKLTPKLSTAPSEMTPEQRLEHDAREAVLAAVNQQSEEGPKAPIAAIPLLLQNTVPGIEDIADEKERLKHDISMRPDVAGWEAYENVPIEVFGEAMLRGMGWEPGKPVGLNATVVVEPIEFVPRHHRGGLGAEVIDEVPQGTKRGHRHKRRDETSKPRMRLPDRADGRKRHVKTLDEELIEIAPTTVRKGVLVFVSQGRHEGLTGRVETVSDGQCTVKLSTSEQTVKVSLDAVSIVDEPQLQYDRKYGLFTPGDIRRYTKAPSYPAPAPSPPPPPPPKKHKSSHRSSSEDGKGSRPKDDTAMDVDEEYDAMMAEAKGRDWLRPHIRVKVLNRSLQGGRLYLQRGEVVDIPQPGIAAVRVEAGSLVELPASELETALPKVGGQVAVLRGTHAGTVARLLKRDSDRNRGTVQLEDSLAPLECSLDDIAEWVGGLGAMVE